MDSLIKTSRQALTVFRSKTFYCEDAMEVTNNEQFDLECQGEEAATLEERTALRK